QLIPGGDAVMSPGRGTLPCRVTVTPKTCLNVAVTEWLAVIVGAHGTVPRQSCVQPVNLKPGAATGVSVSSVPYGKGCAHGVLAGSHAELPGPTTLPLPTTITRRVFSWIEKFAAAARLSIPLVLSEHGPAPVQSPVHPMKSQPIRGVGVSLTGVPRGKSNCVEAHVSP